MRRRNGAMSAGVVGLLLVVGGSSLVLYAVLARRLAPPVALPAARIVGASPAAKSSAPAPSGNGSGAVGVAPRRSPGAALVWGPLARTLSIALPSPGEPSPGTTSPTPAASVTTSSPSPSPSPTASATPEPSATPSEEGQSPSPSLSPTPLPTDPSPSQPGGSTSFDMV